MIHGILIGLVLVGYVAWCWYAFDTLIRWHRRAGSVTLTNLDGTANTGSDLGPGSYPGTDGHHHSNGHRATLRAAGRDPRRRAIRRDYFGPSASAGARGRASYQPDA